MNELALFAGAGGGILGGHLLGWRTVCAVEWEPYPASVLAARQNDGLLPAFPVWDDVRTFDGRPWAGIVDVVSGGFPCQDISAAGNGAGIDGERSGMWREMARIIGEVRPQFVFVENSPLLVGRGLARVLGDLAQMGFDAQWGVLGAHDVGAPHRRERCWVVAHAERAERWPELRTCDGLALVENGIPQRKEGAGWAGTCGQELADTDSLDWWPGAGRTNGQEISNSSGWLAEPDVGRVANGVAARVDRLKAIGNGQVPQCAAQAWRILTDNVESERGEPR